MSLDPSTVIWFVFKWGFTLFVVRMALSLFVPGYDKLEDLVEAGLKRMLSNKPVRLVLRSEAKPVKPGKKARAAARVKPNDDEKVFHVETIDGRTRIVVAKDAEEAKSVVAPSLDTGEEDLVAVEVYDKVVRK